jgi:hypothetical protein
LSTGLPTYADEAARDWLLTSAIYLIAAAKFVHPIFVALRPANSNTKLIEQVPEPLSGLVV